MLIHYVLHFSSLAPFSYGVYGNFSRFPISAAFDLPAAIGGFYPMDPKDISVKFYMYTCKNRYRPYEIMYDADDEFVKKSPFIKEKRTVFIIHGYLDLFEEMGWMGVSTSGKKREISSKSYIKD